MKGKNKAAQHANDSSYQKTPTFIWLTLLSLVKANPNCTIYQLLSTSLVDYTPGCQDSRMLYTMSEEVRVNQFSGHVDPLRLN